MGGYGSGWRGAKKATVEDSLVLTAASLVRKRALVAGEKPGKPSLVHYVALLRRDVRPGSDLLGVAGDGGDNVTTAGQLGDDTRAGISGRTDDGDLQENSPCDMMAMVSNGD